MPIAYRHARLHLGLNSSPFPESSSFSGADKEDEAGSDILLLGWLLVFLMLQGERLVWSLSLEASIFQVRTFGSGLSFNGGP